MFVNKDTVLRGRNSGFRKARRPGPWFQLVDDGADTGDAVLKIYDEIDDVYGLSAAEFTDTLFAIDADNITLRINSPGGLIFDGLAIYHSVRDHPARVTSRIDGVAASIAGVIALAADRVVMSSPASYFMIHNPTAVAMGDGEELMRTTEFVMRMTDNFAQLYADRSGRDQEDIRAEMAAETWFIGEEAIEAGFADEVIDHVDTSQATQLAARFNFARFQHTPTALRHPPGWFSGDARPEAPAGDRPGPATRDHDARDRSIARRRMRADVAART